ncbi:MAG TPA: hypothetical protein VGH31_05030, partial [Acidimicrobiales bacterium]
MGSLSMGTADQFHIRIEHLQAEEKKCRSRVVGGTRRILTVANSLSVEGVSEIGRDDGGDVVSRR